MAGQPGYMAGKPSVGMQALGQTGRGQPSQALGEGKRIMAKVPAGTLDMAPDALAGDPCMARELLPIFL